MSSIPAAVVAPTCSDSEIAVPKTSRRRKPLTGWRVLRQLGFPVVGRGIIAWLDLTGTVYVLHGFVPGLRSVTPHLSPSMLLVISGDPIVLQAEAASLPFALFLTIVLPRMLLGDILSYIIARRSVELLQERRAGSWKQSLRDKFGWLQRLCAWLKNLRGWPLTTALFVLKVAPWAPVPAAVLAGIARVSTRRTAIVLTTATFVKLVYMYKLSGAM